MDLMRIRFTTNIRKHRPNKSARMAACNGVMIMLFIPLLAPTLPCSAAKGIRGIDPIYESKYDAPDGKYSCSDGSKTIPARHINDAFCDCFDGSDEPGMGLDI